MTLKMILIKSRAVLKTVKDEYIYEIPTKRKKKKKRKKVKEKERKKKRVIARSKKEL